MQVNQADQPGNRPTRLTRAVTYGILAGAITGTAIVMVGREVHFEAGRAHQRQHSCPSMPMYEPVSSAVDTKTLGLTCYYAKSRYAIGALLRVRVGPLP